MKENYLEELYNKYQKEGQVLLIAEKNKIDIKDRPRFYEKESPDKTAGSIADWSG